MLHVGIGIGTFVVHVGSVSRDDTFALKNARPWRGRYRWVSMVGGGEHGVIIASHLLVLSLQRSGLNVVLIHGHALYGGRLRRGTARAAVVANIVDHSVVHDGVVDIGVVNDGGVHVGDCGVVMENAAAPLATDETDAAIAESVINATVEADVWSPISGVPSIGTTDEAPIARSPEEPGSRSKHPSARNPVVTVGTIRPIAGSPNVARSRAYRLNIDRESRRADVNRDAHGDLRWGGRGQSQSGKSEKEKQSCKFRHTNHGEVPLVLHYESLRFRLPSVSSKLGAS